MRAMVVTELAGPAGLRLLDVAEPADGGDVLIDVAASGVGFPDLLLARGAYQDRVDPPFIPGVEVAGTVRSAPDGSGLLAGQRVAAYVRRGGWAEVVRCRAEFVFALPDDIPVVVAAGLPLNYLTAHLALARRAQVQPGDSVLILGASGGVGSAAIQVANGLGARPIAVTSTTEKADAARRAGAADVVSGSTWPAAVKQLVGRVDVVVDPVGGDAFDEALRLLRPEGRYLVIGFASGTIPSVRVNRLLLRNANLLGVAWGPTLRAEPEYAATQWAQLMAMHAAGHLAPLPGPVFALADAAAAFRALEDRTAIGKLTLRVR